jgi:hypothetical protein
MTWSIFKDITNIVQDEMVPCYTAWFIDQDMETNHSPNRVKFLHDGEVDVYYDSDGLRVTCTVENGQWAADTERKILKMVSETYWGTFIEGFYRKNGKIYVTMGS